VGFEHGIFCSVGGRDDHNATPPWAMRSDSLKAGWPDVFANNGPFSSKNRLKYNQTYLEFNT
jgi:hypothetical protein